MSNLNAVIPESIALGLQVEPLISPDRASQEPLGTETQGPHVAQEPVERKVRRGRAGYLAGLKDMPMDIFLEIVTWLLPADLLRMARSCKYFRSILMARGSRRLWVASFRNVPDLPPCPSPYISEPRFASVLFDKHCFACGAARAVSVFYTGWVRLCSACYKTNCVKGEDLPATLEMPPALLSKLPQLCSAVIEWSARYDLPDFPKPSTEAKTNSMRSTFYVPELKAVAAELLSLETDAEGLQRFVDERMEFVTLMQTHAISVIEWVDETANAKVYETENVRRERKAAILEKLNSLGYTAEDFPNNEAWRKIVYQPTKLTERIWRAVFPKLQVLIEQKREENRRAAFERRLDERRVEFAPFYDDFLRNTLPHADRPFAPNLYDVGRTPSVMELLSADDATAPVTRRRVAAIHDRLVLDVRSCASRIKREMVEMLYCYREVPTFDAQIDLELTKGTSLFICDHGPSETALPRSAADACAHWRAEHPWLKFNEGGPLKRPAWEYKQPTVTSVGSVWRTVIVLASLGLPEDISMAQLDSWVREGRLICRCGHPELASLCEERGWCGLMHHVNKEVDLYVHMQARQPPRKLLQHWSFLNSHCMSTSRPFLELLGDGQRAIALEFAVPDDVAAAVTALLDANDVKPTCRTCYDMANYACQDMYLEKDVQVLAHHMKTRHNEVLTPESICFHHHEI